MPAEGRPGERGFSLLEVLVAFVILAMALAVLFRIFSSGLRSLTVTQGYTQAALLAQSHLERASLTQPLTEGETDGKWGDGYFWRQTVEPYTPWEQEQALTRPIQAWRVTLQVSWGNPQRPRQLTLSSIRLQTVALSRGGNVPVAP